MIHPQLRIIASLSNCRYTVDSGEYNSGSMDPALTIAPKNRGFGTRTTHAAPRRGVGLVIEYLPSLWCRFPFLARTAKLSTAMRIFMCQGKMRPF